MSPVLKGNIQILVMNKLTSGYSDATIYVLEGTLGGNSGNCTRTTGGVIVVPSIVHANNFGVAFPSGTSYSNYIKRIFGTSIAQLEQCHQMNVYCMHGYKVPYTTQYVHLSMHTLDTRVETG